MIKAADLDGNGRVTINDLGKFNNVIDKKMTVDQVSGTAK